MQRRIRGRIAGEIRVAVVEPTAGPLQSQRLSLIKRICRSFFDDVEGPAVDDPDFVMYVDATVGRGQRAVGDQPDAFELPAAAPEIRLCLGDDDVRIKPLW